MILVRRLCNLAAIPCRVADSIGRRVGLIDGNEHPESPPPAAENPPHFGELLEAQRRANELLTQLLDELAADRGRPLGSTSTAAADDLVRRELERLASAQAQMNEIVGALIEGLGELTRLQTATVFSRGVSGS